MARIAVTGRLPEEALHALRAGHEVVAWRDEDAIGRTALLELVAGADAVVPLLSERVDADLLDAAGPQLRVVANVAVGVDNIDLAACAVRDVVVTNTPGVLTDATADLAMALILAVTRRLGEAERRLRSGELVRWGMFVLLGTGLQGRTLGIVGLGAIGAATARRARAFGMRIVFTKTSPADPGLVAELDAEHVDLPTLLRRSDIVSLHCPATEQTRHLVGSAELDLLGPSGFLVNTARGSVVDEDALVRALVDGTIAGAGLDVYADEPHVPADLLCLDNVVLLPHLGSATVQTRTAMATLAADNALAVLAGEPPVTPVATPG